MKHSLCLLIILGSLLVSCGRIENALWLTPSASTPAAQVATNPNTEDIPWLAMNNFWVFQATRYEAVPITEMMTTTFVITETVVEVKRTESYFAARIHQDKSAEIPVVIPPSRQDEPLRPATSSDYWLVVNGNRIYRQETNLDVSALSHTGTVMLMLPLNLGEKWYLSDEMERLDSTHTKYSMLREVTRVGAKVVPAGHFENCFLLTEVIGGGTFEKWLCPTVGFIEEKDDHHGTPFGSQQVLIEYHVQG